MRYRILSTSIGTVCLGLSLTVPVWAQGTAEGTETALAVSAHPTAPATSTALDTSTQTLIPRLIKFHGMLTDLAGKPISGPVEVTFSLYSDEAGGNAHWYETQTVQADAHGRYTVLLGAMSPSGVPMELFTSGEAHWLGVMVQGLPEEQPRVLLVSVPYAMTAGNAETLGGKPASAFLLAPTSGSDSTSGTPSSTKSNSLLISPSSSRPTPLVTGSTPVTTAGGTTGTLPLWDSSSDITDSVLTQSGTSLTFPGTLNATGAMNLTAGGSNQNLTLAPSGTGYIDLNPGTAVRIPSTAGTGLGTPTALTLRRDSSSTHPEYLNNSTLTLGNGDPTNGSYTSIQFVARDGSGAWRSGAAIAAVKSEYGRNEVNSDLVFITRDMIYGTGIHKALRINQYGNVGIGMPPPPTQFPQYKDGSLYVAGNVFVNGYRTTGSGVIVKSPDGTKCARIGIDNTGALTVTSVTCP